MRDGLCPCDLPAAFRARAAELEPYAPPAAVAFREAAAMTEAALATQGDQPLGPEEAEQESGYTWSHLQRLNRENLLPFTEDGRVLRRNLPKKPGYGVVARPAPRLRALANTRQQLAGSNTQVARSVAEARD